MKHVTAVTVFALLAVAGGTGRAQPAAVTVADVEQVQARIAAIGASASQLPPGADSLRRDLQAELAELDEEAVYLKVKVRKDTVTWAELEDLRWRVDDVEQRLRRGTGAGALPLPAEPPAEAGRGVPAAEVPPPPPPSVPPAPPVAVAEPGVVPVGQQLDVRLQTRLSSETAQVEDRFEATTLVDMYQGERLLIPAGSLMRGVVSSVERAGRLDRKGSLTLTFDQLTVAGVAYPLRATVTQTLESRGVRGEATRIGVGAGVGAILGGILAGAQGAAAGLFIGAGGTLAALPGKDVEVEAGQILRVRIDTPVRLR